MALSNVTENPACLKVGKPASQTGTKAYPDLIEG